MISIFRPLWNGTTISNAAGDAEIIPASDLMCLGKLARDIVSAHLRPGYADRIDTVTAIELALEIGLKAVQGTTFPNLPEKAETSQTR